MAAIAGVMLCLASGQTWTRTLDGGYSGDDEARSVAVTPSGDVVVAGLIGRGTYTSCAFAEYSSAGERRWLESYDPYPGFRSYVRDIVIARDGSIFAACVCNDSSNTLTTEILKLTPDGHVASRVPYSDSAHVRDEPVALVLDGQQNCYAVCWSFSSGAASRELLMKLDSGGSLRWTSSYASGGNQNQPRAIAVDGAGCVYVAGEATTSWSYAATLVKFNPNGETCWTSVYNPPGDNASFFDVSVPGGTPFVAGHIQHGTPRYLTARYDGATGDTSWTRQGIIGCAFGVAALDTAGVAVCGYAADSLTQDDFKVLRYAGDGSLDWVRRYDGPGHGYDRPSGLALDSSGGIFVTGVQTGGTTETDCVTLCCDLNGYLLWAADYTGTGQPSYDQGSAVCLDSQGSVVVVGYATMQGTGKDMLIMKYPPWGPGIVDGGLSASHHACSVRPIPSVFPDRCRFEMECPPGLSCVKVMDLSGRTVREFPLVNTMCGAPHSVTWDATDAGGRPVPSGVYFITLNPGVSPAAKCIVRR